MFTCTDPYAAHLPKHYERGDEEAYCLRVASTFAYQA
jgi:hypothetical protein